MKSCKHNHSFRSIAFIILILVFLCGLSNPLHLKAADPVYPLKISESKRYLVDQTNIPFLIHAETPWSLIKNLTKEKIELYLENRKAKGFNTLIVNILDTEPYPNGGDVNFRDVRNRYGEDPFSRPGGLIPEPEKPGNRRF